MWRSCKPHLTTPDKWTGGKVSSNHYVNDCEAGRRQKGQLARTSDWNSAHLQCHLIWSDGVQPTLFNLWTQAKAPSWSLLPHLEEHRGPHNRCLCQVCGRIPTVQNHLRAALQEAQTQSMTEAQTKMVLWPENRCCRFEVWQSCLSQGRCLSREEEDLKDRWEDKPHEVVHYIATDVPLYEVKDQHGHSHVLHHNRLLLIASEAGIPLCVGVHQVQDRCTSPTSVKPTSKGSDSKTTPQEDDGLVITQHQARKTSLGWINGKLQLLLWMSTGAST